MTSAMHDSTVLPPNETKELAELLRALANADGGTIVLGERDVPFELPQSALDALKAIVKALSEGLAITIVPQHTRLTTQEAADLLGISRPTLVKLLNEGAIPYEQTTRHRRLRLQDVLTYRERARDERARRLTELTQDAEKLGLYEATETPRPTR